MSIQITITECYGANKRTALRARTDDLEEALSRAIRKGYGAGRYFCRDYGLSVGSNALEGSQYGQIGHSVKGYTSLDTGRVCIRAQRV